MKCLVIGGKGFIGGAIVRQLLDYDFEVDVADKDDFDIKNYLEVYHYMQHRHYDHVYHMAGILGTSELNEDIAESVRVNVIGAINVMAACRAMEVSKLFYPSKPNPWLNMYTITKEASEKLGQLFNKESNLQVVSLRYFNVFGPGQHTYPVRKAIPVWCLCARFGIPLPIYGDGHSIVDMCDISTTARMTVAAMLYKGRMPVCDLGTGIGRRVVEVARDIIDIVGLPETISPTPSCGRGRTSERCWWRTPLPWRPCWGRQSGTTTGPLSKRPWSTTAPYRSERLWLLCASTG